MRISVFCVPLPNIRPVDLLSISGHDNGNFENKISLIPFSVKLKHSFCFSYLVKLIIHFKYEIHINT